MRDESRITSQELAALQQLQVEDESRTLTRFFAEFENVVAALKSKATATQRGDTASADEAQLALDTAEAEARALGEKLRVPRVRPVARRGPGDHAAPPTTDTDATAPTDTTVTPTPDTGGVTPTDPVTTPHRRPRAPDDDTGGITP